MAVPVSNSGWQRAILAIHYTVLGVVIIGFLYFARAILIPIALALFLTFLLTPLVTAVERVGLGRTLSVLIIFTLLLVLLFAVSGTLLIQVSGLVADLPSYSDTIRERIRAVREMGESQTIARLSRMMQDINNELTSSPGFRRIFGGTQTPGLVVQTDDPGLAARIPSIALPVVNGIISAGFALVLLLFMLLRRESLRNRFIWIVGDGRITATTKAVDDAGERISRFLMMQFIVNSTYGIAWGVGLFFIGVNYAALWGFLAAVMRYVPYVGPTLGAVLPMMMALVESPSWEPLILVVIYLIILELVSNNVVEPLCYGHSIGVSEVALLISAAFWTFIWGPIGLVLSAPLTVCLAVLGRHVSQLEFLAVLLGDKPVLDPYVSLYQRLLARDQDEAEQLIMKEAKVSAENVYDNVLIPALNYAKRDREQNEFTPADEQFILQATAEILEDLGEKRRESASSSDSAVRLRPVRLLACPAHDEEDRLALEMLRELLDSRQWSVEIVTVETLASEIVSKIEQDRVPIICIAALPPGGLAHTRYLCKRIRSRAPDVKIMVGRWGLKNGVESNEERLREAGGDYMATTLLDTVRQLSAWLPVMAAVEHPPAEAHDTGRMAVG